MKERGQTTIEVAVDRLRFISQECEEGALLGSEEALITMLGVSRSTLRQAARLLEREGMLHVRRGPSGGYFAARPDVKTIGEAVSSYLMAVDIEMEDVTIVATALWEQVVRNAASRYTEDDSVALAKVKARVAGLKLTSTFAQILDIEQEVRKAIFKIAHCPYIELIFDINTSLAARRIEKPTPELIAAEQGKFARAWRRAILMQLVAIAEGDGEIAALAAKHVRKIWNERVLDYRQKRDEPQHPAVAA